MPYHVGVYRLLTRMRAGQGLSFDRNSKNVEILSEMYLQSVQVASPTVTDYGGLSEKLQTAERHPGKGEPASVLSLILMLQLSLLKSRTWAPEPEGTWSGV